MICLESCYLANILLYIPFVETIIKFKLINKKCEDASKIIRFCRLLKLKEEEGFDNFLGCVTPNNLFEIFPNIETIDCREVPLNLDITKRAKQLKVKLSKPNDDYCDKEIRNKVIDLTIDFFSIAKFRLSDYINVRTVRINCHDFDSLKNFFGDLNLHLDLLVIETEYSDELHFVKQYKNITKIVLILNNLFQPLTKEIYNELRSFSEVKLLKCMKDVEIKESVFIRGGIKLDNTLDIERLNELLLFKKCTIGSDCDLRGCEFLEKVEREFSTKNVSIRIEGLKQLKVIDGIKKVDSIPPSLTQMQIPNCFNFNELLEKDHNCFKNIKEITFYYEDFDMENDENIFLNFSQCTRMAFVNRNSLKNTVFKIPSSVIHLKYLYISKTQEELLEISKQHQLKTLSMEVGIPSFNIDSINQMFQKLNNLENLSTNSEMIRNVSLPTNVTFLSLNATNYVDLSEFTHIKHIQIYSEYFKSSSVKLPLKIQNLRIDGDVLVTNPSEVEVERIIFCHTPSQNLKWKCSHIAIENEF